MSTTELSPGETLLVVFYIQFTASFIYDHFDSVKNLQYLVFAVTANLVRLPWNVAFAVAFCVVSICGMAASALLNKLASVNNLSSDERRPPQPATAAEQLDMEDRTTNCRAFGVLFVCGVFWALQGTIMLYVPSYSPHSPISYLVGAASAFALVGYPMHRSTISPIPDELSAIRKLIVLTALPLVPLCYFPDRVDHSTGTVVTLLLSMAAAVNLLSLFNAGEIKLPPGYDAAGGAEQSIRITDGRRKMLYWLLFYAAPLALIWSIAFLLQQSIDRVGGGIEVTVLVLVLAIAGALGLCCMFIYSANRPLVIFIK